MSTINFYLKKKFRGWNESLSKTAADMKQNAEVGIEHGLLLFDRVMGGLIQAGITHPLVSIAIVIGYCILIAQPFYK